jgi:hypothetical protein
MVQLTSFLKLTNSQPPCRQNLLVLRSHVVELSRILHGRQMFECGGAVGKGKVGAVIAVSYTIKLTRQ